MIDRGIRLYAQRAQGLARRESNQDSGPVVETDKTDQMQILEQKVPAPAAEGEVVTPATTEGQLAAAFARTRQARREAASPSAKNGAKGQPSPKLPKEQTTPAPEAIEDTDDSLAASAADEVGDDTGGHSQPTDEVEAETLPEVEAGLEPGDEAQEGDEAEPEAGAEAEEEHEETEVESRGLRGMQKRIDKLTARLRESERALAEAKSAKPAEEAPEAKVAAMPGPAGEFSHDPELRETTKQIEDWKRVATWLEENPDGGEVRNDRGEVQVDVAPEQARTLKRQADEMLAELRANRSVRLRDLRNADAADRAMNDRLFAQHFAWSKDPVSKEMQFVKTLEQRVPEIKRLPGWKLYAGATIEWLAKNGKAQANGNGKTATAPRPPRVAVPSGGGTPKVSSIDKQLAAAQAAYEKSGSVADFERVQVLKRQARRAG